MVVTAITDRFIRGAAFELAITRIVDAPRHVVFDVWTDPAHLVRWWGPTDFWTPELEMELRPGGAWRARMISRQGDEYLQEGFVCDVIVPERLVFTWVWLDQPDYEMLATLHLRERGPRTEMTFRLRPFRSVESRDSHVEGWNECFDRLDRYLEREPSSQR